MNSYQEFCRSTAVYPDAMKKNLSELMYLSLGLAGEGGEIANKVKKLYRDGETHEKKMAIAAELGDIAWYLARLCDTLDVDLDDVLEENKRKLSDRMHRGVLKGNGDLR